MQSRRYLLKKKLTIIHTTMATLNTLPSMIHETYEEAFEIVNVLDDSLLNEIKAKGRINKGIIERFVQYVLIAQHNGSDAILLACSSIGKAADIAREILSIPLYKIDEPMAETAAETGQKILVLGTVNSTLMPTSELIKSKLNDSSKVVDTLLIPNVFEYYSVDRIHHDKEIAQVICTYQNQYDVIVLAQASMSGASKLVKDCHANLLSSLPMGLNQLNALLEQ